MLDLFSGIGGFSLAASWTGGIETVAFCEIEPFCQQVLRKHWPDTLIHDDIRTLRGDDVGPVDIVCGGFPCQPFSVAGRQRGKEDDRYLWPDMFRIIQETKPAWVVGENVPGLINMELEQCFLDLESAGYEVQPFVIPACAVDAQHTRYRVWIVAYSASIGRLPRGGNRQERHIQNNVVTDPLCIGRNGGDSGKHISIKIPREAKTERSKNGQFLEMDGGGNNGLSETGATWAPEPGVGRVVDGLPDQLDRIKALGNSIVPQVVYPILQGIVDIEEAIT